MTKKPQSFSVSSLNLRADAASQRRMVNRIFQAAAKKAPLFQRKSASGRAYASHAASSHAYKTLSSHASMAFADMLEKDAYFLRSTPKGELSRAPAMASLSAGSILMLEQVLVAFAQTAFLRAERLRKSVRKQKKPSHAVMAMATKWLASEVNAAEGLAVIPAPPRLVSKPAKAKLAESAE